VHAGYNIIKIGPAPLAIPRRTSHGHFFLNPLTFVLRPIRIILLIDHFIALIVIAAEGEARGMTTARGQRRTAASDRVVDEDVIRFEIVRRGWLSLSLSLSLSRSRSLSLSFSPPE